MTTVAHSLERRRVQSVDSRARSLLAGLVAFWRLDYTPSGSTVDSSGNALTLTDNNTVTAADGPGGRVPYATQFTAVNNEYLERADEALLSMGAGIHMTLAIWVRFDTLAADQAVMGKLGLAGQREYVLYWDAAASRLTFYVTAEGTTFVSTQIANLSTATWYFAVCWYDGVNIYGQINDGTITSTAFTTDIFDGTSAFEIGRQSSGGNQLNGQAASAGLWKGHVLTAAERTYLYANGAGRDLVPGIGFI